MHIKIIWGILKKYWCLDPNSNYPYFRQAGLIEFFKSFQGDSNTKVIPWSCCEDRGNLFLATSAPAQTFTYIICEICEFTLKYQFQSIKVGKINTLKKLQHYSSSDITLHKKSPLNGNLTFSSSVLRIFGSKLPKCANMNSWTEIKHWLKWW